MKIKLEVEEKDLKDLFYLMQEINDFFHNEINYEDVHKFGRKHYKQINHCFYRVLWEWLLEDEKKKIEDS
ncbi:hypothetical protein [Roseivirga sp.]|uniref:hypothetical protein n=1 Tax=Roseivirga sp. TaxID=1964215 RepID=UPI002B269C40|nr:hypothetical protein [Roseivirga sp.]